MQGQTINLYTQTIFSCNLHDNLFVIFDGGIMGKEIHQKQGLVMQSLNRDRIISNNAKSSYVIKWRPLHLQG